MASGGSIGGRLAVIRCNQCEYVFFALLLLQLKATLVHTLVPRVPVVATSSGFTAPLQRFQSVL